MVNDQLIRIHHLKLLSIEKLSSKDNQNPSPPQSQPQSPTINISKVLSSSAPEKTFGHDDDLMRDESSEHQDDNSISSPFKLTSFIDEHKKQRKRFYLNSKSQNSSPNRNDFVRPLKKQDSQDVAKLAVSGANISTKRRSSWRYLLSPSYKSRSDEFHKFFADEVPKNERLVADYSCALHREILIQGRIYVSINYIAFYSNLFSWVTKLIVRLRDITEIYKANTAKIIPNAIQFVTNKGEKHVFASFLARDKSYLMILRIWRNNLLKERMTDQEIRTLVHCGYGKDLGISDTEELKINSPDPKSPASLQPISNESSEDKIDGNNNSDIFGERNSGDTNSNNNSLDISQEPPPQRAPSPLDLSDEVFGIQPLNCKETGHIRYNSVDHLLQPGRQDAHNRVVDELVKRLDDLSKCQVFEEDELDEHCSRRSLHSDSSSAHLSPVANSTVVVETPECNTSLLRKDSNVAARVGTGKDDCEKLYEFSPSGQDEDLETRDHYINSSGAYDKDVSNSNITRQETIISPQIDELKKANDRSQRDNSTEDLCANGATDNSKIEPKTLEQNTEQNDEACDSCGCDKHEGQFIADEEFDLDIDTLFTLIFTNSKFMRAHMVKRGVFNSITSKWRKSSPNGTLTSDSVNPNSLEKLSLPSTLPGENSRRGSIDSQTNHSSRVQTSIKPSNRLIVQPKQTRQLIYSMNINHILAKQVKVTEHQKICSAKPGVYVLKSSALNSGIPYAETFTIDITYCLTAKNNQPNKSRMLVHCMVNFRKEKLGWRLAMVKSTIEKSSIAGVVEFMASLKSSIKEYINEKIRKRKKAPLDSSNACSKLGHTDEDLDGLSLDRRSRRTIASSRSRSQHVVDVDSSLDSSTSHKNSIKPPTRLSNEDNNPARWRSNQAKAKSKLKERKLRSMYKYYLSNTDEEQKTTLRGSLDSRRHPSRMELSDDADNSSTGCDTSRPGLASSSGSLQRRNNRNNVSSEDYVGVIDDDEDDDNESMMMIVTNQDSDSLLGRLDTAASVKSHSARHMFKYETQRHASKAQAATSHKLAQTNQWHQRQLLSTRGAVLLATLVLSLLIVVVGLCSLAITRRLDSIEEELRRIGCSNREQPHQLHSTWRQLNQ